jgi:hypothetical protein
MKTFLFTVVVQGTGRDESEAWQDALIALDADPGEPHSTELIEEEEEND